MWEPTAAKRSYFGGGVMPMVARYSAVSLVIVLLSARAEAASLFSNFEYHSFWSDVLPIILIAVVVLVVNWQLRKKLRQQLPSALQEARRNPQERRLHLLSLLLIAAPMFYSILFEAGLILPVAAILVAQAVALVALRALGLPFWWKLLAILPAGLLSILAGAFAISWPVLTLPPVDQAWTLAASAACFALGALLSYLSFPPAYRERAW